MHFEAAVNVDGNRFISSCSEFKYLGCTFVPKLSHTPEDEYLNYATKNRQESVEGERARNGC
jgi:hypothetical protein